MAYCTRQDLVDRIGEALLREVSDIEDAGVVNEGRVARACEAATAEVNGALQPRYPAPFATPPALVRSLAVDIAIYQLFVARGHDAATADGVWAKAYANAQKTLDKMRRGEFSTGESQPPKDAGSILAAPDRVFDRDKMQGF